MTANTPYSPPSRNTANDDTLAGLMELVLTKFLQNTDDMLPAQIVAYDRTTNQAKVQALIQVVTTSAQIISRAQVASVPVLQLGGGGFVVSFPQAAGNTGWLKANDRDISLFKQQIQQTVPNTQRKHSFEDAMFIPDTMMQDVQLAAEDLNNAVFQNLAGTVKIALWSNLIKILAPAGVGIGGTPEQGTILDLQSTTQALAVPRMTTGQKLAIPNAFDGMMVYDTTEKSFSYHANGSWS
jgi:hypothetical protein